MSEALHARTHPGLPTIPTAAIRRTGMDRRRSPVIVIAAMLFAAFQIPPALAEELSGTFSPEQVKAACDSSGGSYSAQGRSGTYGCTSSDERSMVLCNADNKCTEFHQSRTRRDNRKIIHAFGLDAAAIPHR